MHTRVAFTVQGKENLACCHFDSFFLADSYHMDISLTGLPGEQCLGVHLMTVEGSAEINHQHLPLSPKSFLAWMG